MKRNQGGITLLGFIMVLMVVAFFIFLGIRLFPVYSEYRAVVAAMEALAKMPNAGNSSRRDVEIALAKRFDIGYVSSVDLTKNVKLTRTGRGQDLNINYETRRPLAYNLDFVAKFDHTVSLNSN